METKTNAETKTKTKTENIVKNEPLWCSLSSNAVEKVCKRMGGRRGVVGGQHNNIMCVCMRYEKWCAVKLILG
jgi:hypothetical protein